MVNQSSEQSLLFSKLCNSRKLKLYAYLFTSNSHCSYNHSNNYCNVQKVLQQLQQFTITVISRPLAKIAHNNQNKVLWFCSSPKIRTFSPYKKTEVTTPTVAKISQCKNIQSSSFDSIQTPHFQCKII